MVLAIVILSIVVCFLSFFFIRYHLEVVKIEKELANTILDLEQSKNFHTKQLEQRYNEDGIDYYDRKRNR